MHASYQLATYEKLISYFNDVPICTITTEGNHLQQIYSFGFIQTNLFNNVHTSIKILRLHKEGKNQFIRTLDMIAHRVMHKCFMYSIN